MGYEIVERDTGRGIAFGFGSIIYHSANGAPGLGGEPLRNALRSTASTAAVLSADMLPDRIGPRLMQIAGPALLSASRDAINLARREKSDAHAAEQRQLEPVRPIDPTIAVETRAAVRPMSDSDKAAWVQHADLEALTAVAGDGNRVPLRPELYDIAKRRFWIENWAAYHNTHAEHPAEPSLDTVLATGADRAKVLADAERYHEAHQQRLAAVEGYEKAAGELVRFIAAIFGISASEALDRIMGRVDA